MTKTTARDAIANCLLMGRGMYPSPEEWADAVLKRLAHEGFAVVSVEQQIPTTKVVIIESEYGAGMKFEDREFPTLEEARAFCKAHNAAYEDQPTTPGHYKIARVVRPS